MEFRNFPPEEHDYEQWSDEMLLGQLERIHHLQDRIMAVYQMSGEVLEDNDGEDYNELSEQEYLIERELEERHYYQNVDTGEWILDEPED